MKAINRIVWGLIILIVGACSGELAPKEYIEWIRNPENGLHKQKQVGDFMFDVQYKPQAYLLLQQKQGQIPKKAQFDQEMHELANTASFELKLGAVDGKTDLLRYKTTNQAEYDQKVYYYSFKFQESIYLEQGDQKFPCAAYHFERAYNLKNNRSFILGFDGVDTTQPMRLVIDADVLHTGPVKLSFDASKIPILTVAE